MAIYCISDIHGCYNEFMRLIDLIEFDPAADHLYILGDIIDRGPQSAEMLWWCTKEAPASVHCLLGNHEDMCYAANKYNARLSLRISDNWSHNHGWETIEQVRNFEKYYPSWELEIINWIARLPVYCRVSVNDTDFILVHAGLQSEVYHVDDYCPEGHQGIISIEGTPIDQDIQALLWNRTSWFGEQYDWPFDIVCGHTPVMKINTDSLYSTLGVKTRQDVEGGILHIGPRKHLIDCGCNRGGKLACLRLNDMKEFYVESEKEDVDDIF